MACKITDKQLLGGIVAFRRHPHVGGMAGPESLDELGEFLAWSDPDIEKPLGRATLSLRIADLLERGLLGVRGRGPWRIGRGYPLFTPGLYVTDEGWKYLQGGMVVKTWKRMEREVARRVGGKRVSAPWRKGPDVEGEWLVAECKSRKRLPQWIRDAVAQAVDGAGEYQLPIAVLHQKHQRHDNDLVVMRLEDFWAWFGGEEDGEVPGLPEQDGGA